MSKINSKNIKISGTTLQLIGINIVIFVVFSVLRPSRFPTITNFGSMGFQFPEFGFFTLGIALAMLTGGIDLSIVAVGNLVATVTGFILLNQADATGFSAVFSILLCVLLAALIGVVCGCLNGALVAILGISPILATLGTQNLYTGICMVLTGGKGVFGKFPAALTFIGSGSLFGFIPMPLFLFLVALVLFYIIIHRTPYGFKTQWYGSNNKVSFYSGINTVKTVFITYVFSAVLGAVTGILILARTNTAKYDYGVTYVLQALLVSVLAGVSPEGGKGNILNILFSVFAIQMLDSGFNFMRISSFVRSSTYGALLIISVALEFLIRRYRLKKEVKRAEAAAREAQ